MNLDLETPEPLTPEPPVPVLSDEQLPAVLDPETFAQQLAARQQEAVSLIPTDLLTVKRCAALVETCKVASKYADARRTETIAPHKVVVDEANAIWQPIVKGFDAIARGKSAELTKWVTDERRRDEERQRKALAEAQAQQDALDQKAEQARQAAEQLRQHALQAETVEEAAMLGKEAAKLEAKADKHLLAAMAVTPDIVPQQSKTIDLGGSKLSTRAPKKTWMLAGYDKAKPLKVTDPKLAALIGNLDALPSGVKFLLAHADLNPVYLNKSFGVIPFPAPFAEVDDYGGGSLRGTKP